MNELNDKEYITEMMLYSLYGEQLKCILYYNILVIVSYSFFAGSSCLWTSPWGFVIVDNTVYY